MKIPCSKEYEENVLGSLFIDKNAIYKINLEEDDFYYIKNKKIFAAIIKLRDSNNPIDIVSVGEILGDNLKAIGGHSELVRLTNRVPTASNVVKHSEKIKELSYRRKLLWKMKYLEEAIVSGEEIEKKKQDLVDTGMSGLKSQTIKELADRFIDYYQKPIEYGIMSGIKKIDNITKGFRSGEIITFTADSGIGKSNMLLNIAVNAIKHGKKILYVNIEMDTNDILTRLLAMYNNLSASNIRDKEESMENIVNGLGEMYDKGFKLITDAKIKSNEIIQQAYIEKMKDRLDLLIVDYLNEIKDSVDERENLNIATGNLKDGSIRLEIPVITAYQIDKFARRESLRPKKEDARGSTVVADRASMMFSIVNESIKSSEYNPFCSEDDEMKIWVLKNRNGAKGFAFKDIYLNKKSLVFYEKLNL